MKYIKPKSRYIIDHLFYRIVHSIMYHKGTVFQVETHVTRDDNHTFYSILCLIYSHSYVACNVHFIA